MPSREELPSAERNANLAWLRTRMALERTLLAWIRTASALIGFGFTIFQFFDRLSHMQSVAPARDPSMPRTIALALIACGTIGITIGLHQYQITVRYLWSAPFRAIAGVDGAPKRSPSVIVAWFLAVVGFVTFVALAYRLRG